MRWSEPPTEIHEGVPTMYAHLTTDDPTRRMAAACRRGAFDGTTSRTRHPIRRIRHALAALARHGSTAPIAPIAADVRLT